MRKKIGIIATVLLTGSLVGCSPAANQTSSNNYKSEQTQITAQNKTIASSITIVHASSASAANKSSSSKSTNTDMLSNSTTRLIAVNKQITAQLGDVALPKTDGLSTGSDRLNVRYAGDASNYTIHYSVGNVMRAVNDSAITNEIPYATLTKKTFASSAEAKSSLNFHAKSDDQGLPKVDLGHNIFGVMNSGAGQRYLHWNEGHWSMTVHANAVNGQDPSATAKQVVDLLEVHTLPAPNTLGTGNFDMSSDENTLIWQAGGVTYTLQAKSIETLIKMAASVQ